MGLLDKAEIAARITKIGADIYAIMVDKALAKTNAEKDRKIAALEQELKELRAKL